MRRRLIWNAREGGHFFLPLVLAVLVLPVVAGAGAPPRATPRTILAVFAHPDDEVTIGPLLAHYAKQGVGVHLAIVTSGQRGAKHAKIPPGDRLGAVRETEARAACKAYGIHEPFFLREQDGTLSSMQRHDEIVHRLREIMQKVRPSVIITWGPDGLTGHPDHRAVSNLVTEIFQAYGGSWEKGLVPEKLYYVAYPESKFALQIAPFPRRLASVRDSYISTIVQAQDGLAAAAEAERCYRSQHTPEMMKAFNEMIANHLQGNVYLRLALRRLDRAMKPEADLFDGIP